MIFRVRHRRRNGRRWYAGLVLALVVLLTGSCTSEQPPDAASGPDQQIAAFVSSWQQLNPEAAADFTSDPAAASVMLSEVTTNLHPDSLAISAGSVDRTSPDSATVTATLTWELPNAGTWSYPATWTWQRASSNSDWALDWSPTVVHPKLGERQTLAIRTADPQPGVMVDRNNVQIVAPVRVFSVVLLPGTVPDVAATAAVLAPILAPLDPTITADSIVAGAAAAVAAANAPATDAASQDPAASVAPSLAASGPVTAGEPTPTAPSAVDPATVGYTVINLREPDYSKVKAQLEAIPGMSFPSEVRNLPPTRDFARALLAQVNPVVSDRMLGTEGWKVIIVDTTGGTLETLVDHPAVAGERVTLTIDSTIQQAAELAIADVAQPAMLLAMQPSTGEILAVAQNAPANAQGAPGLTGMYAPGSSFKIVTATAGLEADVIAPGRTVNCPGTVTIDGRLIRNSSSFELGVVDSTLTFARSCNTTFATVSSQLPNSALPDAASSYGIGLDFTVDGITTLTGKVPVATNIVQRAENGFGQGEVLLTPFGAVLMAATAARGTMPIPVLIRGTTTTVDRPAPARPEQVQRDIQTYMRAVVTDGTSSALLRFNDVHAKTGTAEFVAEDGTTQTHAWNVGYTGDMAYATLIVGGGDGSGATRVVEGFLDRYSG